MNDVIALLVESFERLDTAARDFEQGVGVSVVLWPRLH